jgi:arginine/lysine/ornithine decarboxylase
MLHPGDNWHGFHDIADDWCMLDPVKVSILSPGMGEDGKLEKDRSSSGTGERLVQPLRHRANTRYRLPGYVLILVRHHQG